MKQGEFIEHMLSPEKCSSLEKFVPALALSVSLAVTYQLGRYEHDMTEQDAFNRFDTRKEEVFKRVIDRMDHYSHTLKTARALFAGGMDRKVEFHNFVRDLDIDKEYAGALGYTWAPLVRKSALPEHIKKTKKEMCLDEYQVSPPPGEREEIAPITYVEPLSGSNMKALGYDPLSNPTRRAVMQTARDQNSIGITEKVQLIQDKDFGPRPGFIMNLPVYRNGTSYSTLEERRLNVAGWLGIPINMQKFMAGITEDKLFEGIDVEIYDGESPGSDNLLFDTDKSHNGITHITSALFKSEQTIQMFGHSWTFVVHSLPEFESHIDNGRGRILITAGVGISFFLALLSWLIIRKRNDGILASQSIRNINDRLLETQLFNMSVLDSLSQHIAVIDKLGNIIAVNRAWREFAQRNNAPKVTENALGVNYLEVCETAPNYPFNEEALEVYNGIQNVLQGKQAEFNLEYPCHSPFEERWFRMKVTPLEGGEGGAVISHMNATEHKRAEMKVFELATHDVLTGLPNRKLLADRLEQALKISEREGGYCGVLFVDLDHFKPVNDDYGHEVGDLLLKDVAKRLEAIIRGDDTVARFGGDEFVVVARAMKSEEDVNLIAEKVINALSMPFYVNRHQITIGASIGISLYPRDGENMEELLKFSDDAMYRAKNTGKGKFC